LNKVKYSFKLSVKGKAMTQGHEDDIIQGNCSFRWNEDV